MKHSLAESSGALRKYGHSMSGLCSSCGGACKYAEGGVIKGVHESRFDDKPGTSRAGIHSASSSKWEAGRDHIEHGKKLHREKLQELKEMPSPNIKGLARGGPVHGEGCMCPVCKAHGGKVSHSDMNASESKKFEEKGESDVGKSDHEDSELHEGVMSELTSAIHNKDHKGALEALRALFHSMKE